MTDTTDAAALRKRFGTIANAVDYSGISRAKLYREAACHEGLFKKWGTATRVDFAVLDQIMDGLPNAVIKPQHKPLSRRKHK
jgi:hypothetical protein